MAKEAYVYGQRDLRMWQERPTYMAKETYPTHMAKEACVWGKEAYVYGKRGLRIWQERPTCMAKEAYVYGKRGLITRTGMAYLKAPGVGIGGYVWPL